LANCNISDDGGEAIGKSFLINETCNELNVSDNSMSCKTAKVFGEVLCSNRSLMRLDLSHNRLGENNAFVSLMKGLAMNETLADLSVSWNALGGELFGKLLLKSIKTSKLRTLKMEHNRLSTLELKKLAIGLRRSRTIEEVYIAGNLILGGDDVDLIGAFKSKSPLKLMSFGKWFHLSHEAFKVRLELSKEVTQSIKFTESGRHSAHPTVHHRDLSKCDLTECTSRRQHARHLC
jgi:Leucine Rich repeat